MACVYGPIDAFEKQLTIWGNPTTNHTVAGHPTISCYSLQTWQKWTAISVCALAIILLVVGAASLGGANIIGTKAAWALIGTGGAVATVVIAGTTTNHLLFVKKVGDVLNMTSLAVFQNANLYAGFPDSTADGKSKLQGIVDMKRYAVCTTESIEFYIEFYRTKSISDERSV